MMLELRPYLKHPQSAPGNSHAYFSRVDEHHGGMTAGDQCSSVWGSTLVNGATWLNKCEWPPSGTNDVDEALPGSSNDVNVFPRRAGVIGHCATVYATGDLTEAEQVGRCSANCRECNAKCCLRRRGHATHKCLYHKIP